MEAKFADERAARLAAEAKASSIDALIASLKLQIEKLRRELYGQRSERKASRRKFFELADLKKQARSKKQLQISPMALEAVKRIDALFDIERAINGRPAEERLKIRKEKSAPLMTEPEAWMREERAKLSKHAPVAKAFDYMLRRWDSFARFLEDGRICLTNNSAERALRGLALGRKSWLFAGSDHGGVRAAIMYTLIGTAKLNDIDPQAWLADVLKRIAEHPAQGLDELLPWY